MTKHALRAALLDLIEAANNLNPGADLDDTCALCGFSANREGVIVHSTDNPP